MIAALALALDIASIGIVAAGSVAVWRSPASWADRSAAIANAALLASLAWLCAQPLIHRMGGF